MAACSLPIEEFSLEREQYGAYLAVCPRGAVWGVCFAWLADDGVSGEGPVVAHPDRAQAICGGVRALLESLDAADPLRRNPAVTGVARQRMAKIRVWAEELREKHRPVAVAVPLFGEGA
jgi:hypothetical protein